MQKGWSNPSPQKALSRQRYVRPRFRGRSGMHYNKSNMKSSLNRLVLFLSLMLMLATARVSAYYDPGVQRWINRDPINEPGFDVRDYPRSARASYYGYDFTFVRNAPVALVDSFGLKVWAGKGCKGSDWRQAVQGFMAKCRAAQQKGCFACLGKNAANMSDPCDPNKYGDVVVECEDKSAGGCQATKGKGGTGCGWTDPGSNPAYPGQRVVHVCFGQDKATGCSDTGCTLLHEVAHAAGGVGPDSGDGRAYDIEKCAGCE